MKTNFELAMAQINKLPTYTKKEQRRKKAFRTRALLLKTIEKRNKQ